VKVIVVGVRAGELGTPFNAEIERLRELVKIASVDGIVVGLKTEADRMTQDPDTAKVLCDNVKGLCLTLDPSHYHFGPMAGAKYDHLLPYVCHTQLRDTNKKQFQVKVGQGEIEYGRIITQLGKFRYQKAACVNIADQESPDIDHLGEMRKMRLLLESLL
jgi:sugar phosphate isomerase/epimerase